MPKPKTLLKDAKTKKKTKHAAPESPEEYLAEGVDLEEAGEKWRAGDAVKSMRFFMRAIEMYDTGISRYPSSFDLAYNKARVQYGITQHPKLATQLPAPMLEILHIALRSHREALNLEQDNADILFNTAQVLTSIAETITEGKRPSEMRSHEAVTHLQEALDLFQRCLTLQEFRFNESQEQIKAMESGEAEQGPIPEQEQEQQQATTASDHQGGDPSSGTQSEQWVSVVEPVTKNTLVDTAVAQLETLATFCGLLTFDPGSNLAWIEEYSSDLLDKIVAYAKGTDRETEVEFSRAKFISNLAEVSYRGGRIDLETFKNELAQAFGDHLDISNDPSALCSKAEALVGFNSAIVDCLTPNDQDSVNKSLGLRWQALSTALESLTAASKLAGAENLSKIHLARGDVEINRWRLGRPPWEHAAANENASLLLTNAQTFYRGAAAIARRDGLADEEREGTVREALAKALAGDLSKIQELMTQSGEETMRIAEDMVEDGLVWKEDMDRVFSSTEPEEIVF